MSVLGRTISGRAVAVIAATLVLAGLLPVMTKSPDRTVTLVAKGMTFYLDGDFENPNPTLRFAAGETVRLVLRNADPGMTHDLAVPAADAATDLISWNEVSATTFDVPNRKGTYVYQCRPHMLTMKGLITVE